MKIIFKKPFVECPNLRKLLKPKKELPSFEGADTGSHHQLQSEEYGNKWLHEIREVDNQINDFLNLPHQE